MINTKRSGIALACLVTTLLITACGGGGDSAASGPVASTLSFPVLSAYKSLVANGATKTFTISGTCSGTGNKTVAPASTATTFEGAAALSAAETITISYTNCTPASIAQSSTSYYDNSYIPRGESVVGTAYGVYLTPPNIPTSVTVGGTGIIGTETLWTDSTKATPYGRVDVSYVIEADTSTTAIANVISKLYNASGTLTSTQQSRLRVATTGALVPVSSDFQYANGSTTHLLWTYN